MGAGSSKTVRNIQIEENKIDHKNRKEVSESESTTLKDLEQGQLNKPEKQHNREQATPNGKVTDDREERNSLEKQLIESESVRLDLEDRVQALEEQLEQATRLSILQEERSCDETLHAKDQYITKLEQEKSELGEEVKKWKMRHRRKVKALNSQLTEEKQEANFQMMELREEVKKLQAGNKDNSGKSKSESVELPSLDASRGGMESSAGRMKVILELSSQVAEQNERIASLEAEVSEKDQIVKELRTKLRNNLDYIKARDDTSGERKSPTKQSVGSFSTKQTVVKGSKDGAKSDNIQSLFAVDEEEEEFGESDGLLKLTSLLQGTKANNDKVRISTDSFDLADVDSKDKEGKGVLGSGRDSGLGSAGKRDAFAPKPLIDWPERSSSRASLESGLSDSDFDKDLFSHSKISSAPPKLQNAGQRQKKKSNHLKKRVKENHTSQRPKPTIAFGGDSSIDSPNQNFLLTQKLSPAMSPVHV